MRGSEFCVMASLRFCEINNDICWFIHSTHRPLASSLPLSRSHSMWPRATTPRVSFPASTLTYQLYDNEHWWGHKYHPEEMWEKRLMFKWIHCQRNTTVWKPLLSSFCVHLNKWLDKQDCSHAAQLVWLIAEFMFSLLLIAARMLRYSKCIPQHLDMGTEIHSAAIHGQLHICITYCQAHTQVLSGERRLFIRCLCLNWQHPDRSGQRRKNVQFYNSMHVAETRGVNALTAHCDDCATSTKSHLKMIGACSRYCFPTRYRPWFKSTGLIDILGSNHGSGRAEIMRMQCVRPVNNTLHILCADTDHVKMTCKHINKP